MKFTDDDLDTIQVTKKCCHCFQSFGAVKSKMYVDKRRISNNRVVFLAYHQSCFERRRSAKNREIYKMKNPVGRYGARSGG